MSKTYVETSTELLEGIEPVIHGGEMVAEADYHSLRYAELPYRLEPGTPPIAEAARECRVASLLQVFVPGHV